MTDTDPVISDGRGLLLPAAIEGAARVTLGGADVTLTVGPESRLATYRDLATIAVQAGSVLLILGSGTGAERVVLSRFGQGQGTLVRELRERRFRQQLADALITELTSPLELLEYAAGEDGAEQGVGLVAYHPWGLVLAPLDERLPWIRVRRGVLTSVVVDEPNGVVTATAVGPGRAGRVVLPGLGQRARLHGQRLGALRQGAHDDAARLMSRLIPDAEYISRQEAARGLIDGRPARPADLPSSWQAIETAVLTEPTFAASYQTLVGRAGSLADERAIGMAPVEPGGEDVKSWFFVALPGNLVALELVSEGAHATYCFRGMPRSTFAEGPAAVAGARTAIRDVTDALLDSRFLREPMALPEDQLRTAANLRYRMALRALPSLAAARARFVARLVHRDDASWSASLDDIIAWHGAARDEAAVWPGRAAQDSMVSDAAADDASAAEEPLMARGS